MVSASRFITCASPRVRQNPRKYTRSSLSEFADQAYRINRAGSLPLLVDADHGYGNALNAMRTVEELEHAGVSGMSIEDTALPTRFGQPAGTDELISLDEMVGKLKAAVSARRDPETVILGRTAALKVEGVDGTIKRAKAFVACGVDAIFLVGVESADQVRAVHEATRMPIMVGSAPASIKREDFAAAGARVLLQGHQPVAAVVKTLREAYTHLFSGGTPAELKDKIASAKEMDELTSGAAYKQWQRDFLNIKK